MATTTYRSQALRDNRGDNACRLLHPARTEQPTLDELAELTAYTVDRLSVANFARTSLQERRYWLLARTDLVETWLIEWGSSAFLGLHDHGGSSGAFQVIAGQLMETSTSLETRSPLSTTVLTQDARRSFASDVVHEMWNPTNLSALTVHTYSPPLSSMTFYEHSPEKYLDPIGMQTELEWSRRSEMTASMELPLKTKGTVII